MSLLNRRAFSCLSVVAAAGMMLASCGDDAVPPPPVRVLSFSVEPGNTVAGVDVVPSIEVEIRNAAGTLLDTDTREVTLVIASGPGADFATTSTLTQAAVDGVATFDDINIELAGTYTLDATASYATADTSALFVIAPAAAAKVDITIPGADFTAGGTTTLTVEVQDQYDNTVTSDSATVITFSPYLSGTISNVNVGTGDTAYGTVGDAEDVTVDAGVATVELSDTVAETFEVAISSALTDPANDSIVVAADAADMIVITVPGADFSTGGATTLTVEVQDQYGNTVTTDSTTSITFSPTLSGTISDVLVGTGDTVYNVVGAAEAVTVANGIASVELTDDVEETFDVAIGDGAGGLTDPTDDTIDVTP